MALQTDSATLGDGHFDAKRPSAGGAPLTKQRTLVAAVTLILLGVPTLGGLSGAIASPAPWIEQLDIRPARPAAQETRARSLGRAPPDQVRGKTLFIHGLVTEIAADGSRVAALLDLNWDCKHEVWVVAWQVGTKAVTHVKPPNPGCYNVNYSAGLALTGTSITFSDYGCGNECYQTPVHADIRRPGHIDIGDQGEVPENFKAPHPAPPAETRNGVSISVSHRVITLYRIADGRTRALRPPNGAVDAELENTGLFYAYNLRRGDRPGRVVFVPFAQLFP